MSDVRTRITPRFVRNSHKIHKPTCRYAVACVPWEWAEDKDVDEWLTTPWLIPCRTCLPDLVARKEELGVSS